MVYNSGAVAMWLKCAFLFFLLDVATAEKFQDFGEFEEDDVVVLSWDHSVSPKGLQRIPTKAEPKHGADLRGRNRLTDEALATPGFVPKRAISMPIPIVGPSQGRRPAEQDPFDSVGNPDDSRFKGWGMDHLVSYPLLEEEVASPERRSAMSSRLLLESGNDPLYRHPLEPYRRFDYKTLLPQVTEDTMETEERPSWWQKRLLIARVVDRLNHVNSKPLDACKFLKRSEAFLALPRGRLVALLPEQDVIRALMAQYFLDFELDQLGLPKEQREYKTDGVVDGVSTQFIKDIPRAWFKVGGKTFRFETGSDDEFSQLSKDLGAAIRDILPKVWNDSLRAKVLQFVTTLMCQNSMASVLTSTLFGFVGYADLGNKKPTYGISNLFGTLVLTATLVVRPLAYIGYAEDNQNLAGVTEDSGTLQVLKYSVLRDSNNHEEPLVYVDSFQEFANITTLEEPEFDPSRKFVTLPEASIYDVHRLFGHCSSTS